MPEWLQAVEHLTVAAGAIVIMWLGFKEVWVFGKMHREQLTEIRKDRDEWKELALHQMDVAGRAVKVAERTTA